MNMVAGSFTRFAVFWTPPPGPLALFGAAWLGWDPATGRPVDHPAIDGIAVAEVTATPRKYGLHGTMKAPFRLAPDTTPDSLCAGLDAVAASWSPVILDAVALGRIGNFLCLRPEGDTAPLDALAAETVRRLDPLRAPLTEAEIARRRRSDLSPEADALMLRWGYPHVMGHFRFHVTLSGPLDDDMAGRVETELGPRLAPLLPRPFPIDALTLMGEDADGWFHAFHRAPLTGGTAP